MYRVYEFLDLTEIRHSLKLSDLLVLIKVDQGWQIFKGKSLENRQIDQMRQMQEYLVFLAKL